MSQPLFSEVDEYLREFGFVLFDIERYYLRRINFPLDVPSREQMVWGQAIYFKNLDSLPESNKFGQAIKMAMMASYFGFNSYAVEIFEYLLNMDMFTTLEDREVIKAYKKHISSLNNGRLVQAMLWLDRSFLRNLFRYFGKYFLQLGDAYHFVTTQRKYFWKD